MIFNFAGIAEARPDEPSRAEMMKYARAFYIDVDEDDPSRDGSMVWKSIEEQGWPDSLKPFQARFKPGRSYLTLYKKLPVWPMDMRTPNRFKNSMSSKEIFGKSSIGHMTVGWSCDAGGNRTEGLTGATGEDGQSDEMYEPPRPKGRGFMSATVSLSLLGKARLAQALAPCLRAARCTV